MNKSTDPRTQLLTQKPFKLMLSLSLPAIIGMVVIGLYNFMDAVFVGQMLGPNAMTAVTTSYPFTLINSSIATLVGVGSASVLSRAVGKRDTETIDKIMGNLIGMVGILSIIVTVLGIVFTREILSLTGAEGEIFDNAVSYLQLIFIGSLFVNFAQSANMVMRGEGILKRAMMIMGGGAILNIILDPILIYITKDIRGAAFATLISQLLQAVVTIWYFLKKSENVRINKVSLDKKLIPQVLGVGVSAMLMQLMTMIQQTLMFNTAAQYGSGEWQTVLGASLRLQAFAFIPIWGLSQGYQPAIGTNYGAKEYDRVKRITGAFLVGASIFSLVFYIPVMCFPKAMLSMFITDGAICEMGASSTRLFFSTYITLGIMILSITFFQSLGKGGMAAMLTVLRQVALFVPLVLLLPRISTIGVQGVFLAPVITDIGVLVLSVVTVLIEFRKMNKEKEQKLGNVQAYR